MTGVDLFGSFFNLSTYYLKNQKETFSTYLL